MRTDPALRPREPLSAAIKYNPHLWGPDELRAIFVVRQTDLAQITEQIVASPRDQVPQHLLISGHRGMGKSTLLHRLALAVNETPELAAQWLPLIFPEEQYTVSNLGEFWLNVLDALADALERAGAQLAELALLDAEIQRIADLPRDQIETQAQDFLTGWIEQHQRGLILLVDSSDQLMDALIQGEGKAGKGDASALWRLRRTLSNQKGLFWIGASYQALEASHQYQDAFHDFFALHELRPLTAAEMRAALLALARQFGVGTSLTGEAAEAEMARRLDRRPERLHTLRLLSGGNPRASTALYELFSSGGDERLQSDLERLLDSMTPLYKARMEALSEQPRKLFAHLMEHWHPLGVKELARESGIAATTVSGQLTRLEVEGLIHKAPLAGKTKRNGYQASERLFNIWYLMRLGTRRIRQRLTWAVEFMRMWFSREELGDLAGLREGSHDEAEAAYRQAIALDEQDAWPWANLARLYAMLGRPEAAATAYREALRRIPDDAQAGEGRELRLQAHLWLGNRDSARLVLDALAVTASAGEQEAFYRVREQCWESAQIGLASSLADIMEASPYADFLLPFALALRAWANGETPVGAAPEILALANEILDEIRARQPA